MEPAEVQELMVVALLARAPSHRKVMDSSQYRCICPSYGRRKAAIQRDLSNAPCVTIPPKQNTALKNILSTIANRSSAMSAKGGKAICLLFQFDTASI